MGFPSVWPWRASKVRENWGGAVLDLMAALAGCKRQLIFHRYVYNKERDTLQRFQSS